MPSYLTLDLVGDAGARGTIYGREARDAIQANIVTYQERFAAGGLPWRDAQERVQSFLPALESTCPDLLAEMQATASAAEVDLADLLVLNARTSLIYNLKDDCTSVALTSPTWDRCSVLGQNWDNMERLRPVLLRVAAPGMPLLMTLTEAGTLAKIGFNDAGIGVCVNGLGHSGRARPGSIPIFVFLRRLLSLRSLEAAVALVLDEHRDAPHNYLVASQSEGAKTIETLYEEAEILAPSISGAVFHTNHVQGPTLHLSNPQPPSQNSLLRLNRATELLRVVTRSNAGCGTVDQMLSILSDHGDAPDSICRHSVATGNGFQTMTKHAVVMDLQRLEMHITDGPPCVSPSSVFPLVKPLNQEDPNP